MFKGVVFIVIQIHNRLLFCFVLFTVREETSSIIHMSVLSEYVGLWPYGRTSVKWPLFLERTQQLPFLLPSVAYKN